MPTDTSRLRAAGITRVPFSLKNAERFCAGKRIDIRNCLLPMCIACAIRDPGGRMDPPAVRNDDGVWGCTVGDEVSANHGRTVVDTSDTNKTTCLGGAMCSSVRTEIAR